MPGRSGPPEGSRRPVGGGGGGGGRAGPRCHPEPGPGGRGAAACRSAEFAAPREPGYLWAAEKVALPLRRPPRLPSGAGRPRLAAGRRLARGRGVRPAGGLRQSCPRGRGDQRGGEKAALGPPLH